MHTWTHPKQLEATVTLWQRINARTHGKSQCFVLRLPPQQMSHATFMQPLQCVVQHHVAKSHVWTHMAVDGNNHAAIAQRSATTDSKTSDNYATARCRTPCRNQKHQKERAHPHPMHTQAAFHRRLQPLYPEKTKYFFACGFPCVLEHHVARSHVCAHMAAYNFAHMNNHKLQNSMEEPLPSATTSLSHHFPKSPLP